LLKLHTYSVFTITANFLFYVVLDSTDVLNMEYTKK